MFNGPAEGDTADGGVVYKRTYVNAHFRLLSARMYIHTLAVQFSEFIAHPFLAESAGCTPMQRAHMHLTSGCEVGMTGCKLVL